MGIQSKMKINEIIESKIKKEIKYDLKLKTNNLVSNETKFIITIKMMMRIQSLTTRIFVDSITNLDNDFSFKRDYTDNNTK